MDMCYSTVIFLFSEENIQTVLLKLFTKMEDKKRDIRLAEFVLRTNSETLFWTLGCLDVLLSSAIIFIHIQASQAQENTKKA